jgi:hypothetical protein
MDKTDFSVGDKIFHKSNASIIWIIERIDENEAYCSTVLKDTFEQKKEKFALTSIEKYVPRQPNLRTIRDRRNYI